MPANMHRQRMSMAGQAEASPLIYTGSTLPRVAQLTTDAYNERAVTMRVAQNAIIDIMSSSRAMARGVDQDMESKFSSIHIIVAHVTNARGRIQAGTWMLAPVCFHTVSKLALALPFPP